MDLSNLRIKTKNKKPKRLGRGTGTGKGKTAGRGHKGSGQRKGKKLPYEGYRGGNLPYARAIPKRGFNPPQRTEYQIVNLKDIQKRLKDKDEITPGILEKINLIKNEKKPVKILAGIDKRFSLKVIFKADKFSSKAKEIIENAGGRVEYLNR